MERERSSRHLGLERTSDAFESSQLRHCAGILEQSPRPSAKRGLLSPFPSSVSHHTQRETWSSKYSLQSPAWTRAHDDSGPYCFPSVLSQPHWLPWIHQPTPTIGPLHLPSFWRNTWMLLYFFPGFWSNVILGERSLPLSYRRLLLPCCSFLINCQLPETLFLLLPKCGKLTAEATSSVRNIN